jgi:hypothetical protein
MITYAWIVKVPDVAAGEVTVTAEAVTVSTSVVVVLVVAIETGVDVRTTVCGICESCNSKSIVCSIPALKKH